MEGKVFIEKYVICFKSFFSFFFFLNAFCYNGFVTLVGILHFYTVQHFKSQWSTQGKGYYLFVLFLLDEILNISFFIM